MPRTTIGGGSHLYVLTHLEVVDHHAGQGGGRAEDAACRDDDVDVAGHKSCLCVQETHEEEADASLLKACTSLIAQSVTTRTAPLGLM